MLHIHDFHDMIAPNARTPWHGKARMINDLAAQSLESLHASLTAHGSPFFDSSKLKLSPRPGFR